MKRYYCYHQILNESGETLTFGILTWAESEPEALKNARIMDNRYNKVMEYIPGGMPEGFPDLM